jgi:hypothetical protein
MRSELEREITSLSGRIGNMTKAGVPDGDEGKERLRTRLHKLQDIQRMQRQTDDIDEMYKQEHRIAYESGMPFSCYLDREPLDNSTTGLPHGRMKRRIQGE